MVAALLTLWLLLFSGKAYGIFDMKWLYVASLILFEGGSALCGGAPTMDVNAPRSSLQHSSSI